MDGLISVGYPHSTQAHTLYSSPSLAPAEGPFFLPLLAFLGISMFTADYKALAALSVSSLQLSFCSDHCKEPVDFHSHITETHQSALSSVVLVLTLSTECTAPLVDSQGPYLAPPPLPHSMDSPFLPNL